MVASDGPSQADAGSDVRPARDTVARSNGELSATATDARTRRLTGAARGGVAAGAVVGSYLLIRTGRSVPLDTWARRWMAHRHAPRTDRVIAAASDLGSIYAVAGMATILVARGRRAVGADVAGVGAVAWVAAQALKPLLRRSRPYESGDARRLVAVPAGSSWPSGHAAVAAGMTTVLGSHLGRRGRLAATSVALGVAASRLHVGVHHFTDVVAGLGVGIVVGRGWTAVRRRVGARAHSVTPATLHGPDRGGDTTAAASRQPSGDVQRQ